MHGYSNNSLRRSARGALLAASLFAAPTAALLLTPAALHAQTLAKTVQGKVLNHSGQPLPGSIVYLQDQKSYIVKTFIAVADGSYRFSQLPADTDYKIWARYKGTKSHKTRLISSFDTELTVNIDFHIGK